MFRVIVPSESASPELHYADRQWDVTLYNTKAKQPRISMIPLPSVIRWRVVVPFLLHTCCMYRSKVKQPKLCFILFIYVYCMMGLFPTILKAFTEVLRTWWLLFLIYNPKDCLGSFFCWIINWSPTATHPPSCSTVGPTHSGSVCLPSVCVKKWSPFSDWLTFISQMTDELSFPWEGCLNQWGVG